MNQNLVALLEEYNQEHLLQFSDQLDELQKEALSCQLQAIDWDNLDQLIESHVRQKTETEIPGDIQPAPFFPARPEDETQARLYQRAESRGKELIGNGKVAALTVAGGQGTRLGFDGPKGTFPITPVKKKTLFQYFAESLLRTADKYGAEIKWYIMTSPVNHESSQTFFRENAYFGFQPDLVKFFSQGTMPAIGMDGRLLLATPSSLALAPNGHGGTLLALCEAGVLDEMVDLEIDYLSYFQVDNPLVSVMDPLFVGLHDLEQAEMSCRMLSKTGPDEKLGNFCLVGGRLEIIEYSDMPDELSEQLEPDGRLSFIAGSPAIHIISRSFVEGLTRGGKFSLPWHRADKKVPFVDAEGVLCQAKKPNAVIIEACREDEFSPVKNPSGVDSVESARAMLIDRDTRWLAAAGVSIPRTADNSPDCVVELSPRSFVGVDDLISRLETKTLTNPEPGEELYYE